MNIDEAEGILRASPDHFILNRIPAAVTWPTNVATDDIRRAVFIDTETTGLNLDADEVIEIAILPFDYDRSTGTIAKVDFANSYASFREPSRPIPPMSTEIHGISDDDVRGLSIDHARLNEIVGTADIVIAHNAYFDRPMAEKHWPIFSRKAWACSLSDIAWRAEGLTTGKLDYLLMRMGWFYKGHRAMTDAEAGVFLLNQNLPRSQKSALSSLLENARRPLHAVRAEDTPFEQRATLRQRGYRWDSGDDRRPKAWWILTDQFQTEIDWLRKEIYKAPRDLASIPIPARKRYSAHLWD